MAGCFTLDQRDGYFRVDKTLICFCIVFKQGIGSVTAVAFSET